MGGTITNPSNLVYTQSIAKERPLFADEASWMRDNYQVQMTDDRKLLYD